MFFHYSFSFFPIHFVQNYIESVIYKHKVTEVKKFKQKILRVLRGLSLIVCYGYACLNVSFVIRFHCREFEEKRSAVKNRTTIAVPPELRQSSSA